MELFAIPGLGTKRIRRLYDTLEITSLGELEYACQENRLLVLEGFGPKSQADILAGIETLRRYQESFLYPQALHAADQLREMIEASSKASVMISGGLRRGLETINVIELLISGVSPEALGDLAEQSAAGIPVNLHFPAPPNAGDGSYFNNGQ